MIAISSYSWLNAVCSLVRLSLRWQSRVAHATLIHRKSQLLPKLIEWSGKRSSHFDHWEMRVPTEKCRVEKRMSSRVCHDHIQPRPAKHGDGVGIHRQIVKRISEMRNQWVAPLVWWSSQLTKIPIDNDMKFLYSAQRQGESGNVFSIWFHSVEDALLMQKTMRKHFKCPVSCTWSIDGETYKND